MKRVAFSFDDLLALTLSCGLVSIGVAAALKVVAGISAGSAWNLVIGAIELVFLSALCFIKNCRYRRGFILLAFFGFATVSGSKFLADAQSCGCLGPRIVISPLAMLSFDAFVILAAVLSLFRSRRGESRLDGSSLPSTPRIIFASLLLVGLMGLAVESGSARFEEKQQAGFAGVTSRTLEIRSAFPIELDSGDWEVAMLRQSCPTCRAVLADAPGSDCPVFVAMLVDDAPAFYAERFPGDCTIAPLITSRGGDREIVVPARVRIREGNVVSFRSLPERKGVGG